MTIIVLRHRTYGLEELDVSRDVRSVLVRLFRFNWGIFLKKPRNIIYKGPSFANF